MLDAAEQGPEVESFAPEAEAEHAPAEADELGAIAEQDGDETAPEEEFAAYVGAVEEAPVAAEKELPYADDDDEAWEALAAAEVPEPPAALARRSWWRRLFALDSAPAPEDVVEVAEVGEPVAAGEADALAWPEDEEAWPEPEADVGVADTRAEVDEEPVWPEPEPEAPAVDAEVAAAESTPSSWWRSVVHAGVEEEAGADVVELATPAPEEVPPTDEAARVVLETGDDLVAIGEPLFLTADDPASPAELDIDAAATEDDIEDWIAFAGADRPPPVVEVAPLPAEPAVQETRSGWRRFVGPPDQPAEPRHDDEELEPVALASDADADTGAEPETDVEDAAAVAVASVLEDVAEGDERLDPGDISEEHYFLQTTTQEHAGLAEAVAAAAARRTEPQAVSAAMPGLESGVLGFEDVAEIYPDAQEEERSDEEPTSRSELALRVITALALAAAFFGALWWDDTAFHVLVLVAVTIALGEFYAVLLRKGYQPLSLFGLVGGVIALLGARVWGPVAVPGALIVAATAMFFYYAMAPQRTDPLINGALTLTGVAWVSGFAAFVVPMMEADDYRVLIFATIILTALMDIGQYFAGRSFGERRLAPVISPNKTVEGLIGGAVVALATGALLGQVDPFDTTSGLVLGATVAFVAPFGDLAVSMLKRSLDVKDMGGILPGHGGLLDRIDAMLFVIPAAWLVFTWLGYLS
jgi:CDP-diglyceride synthetase